MNSVRLRVLLLGEFAEMAEFSELSLHEPLTAFTIYPQADTKMADEIDGSQYDVIAVTVASPIEDSLKVIKAVSSRLDTPIMGVLRVADESLEEEVYSAGCRHCFNVEPWSPRELALAVHETAIHDPMLCELLGVPFCEVNWEPNLFGDLLRGIAADAGDARQYFNGSVGERLATAMSASIVNPRYDLQREAILQRFGQLTNKEILVLLHILQGKASGEIAADTGVSDNTIRSQRISALRKLGARTPIELATVLVTIGLQTFMDGNGELIDGKIA